MTDSDTEKENPSSTVTNGGTHEDDNEEPMATTTTANDPITTTDDDDDEAEPSGKMKDVYVRFGRQSLTIKADFDDTFLELRRSVEKETGVPIDEQELTYNGLPIQIADDKSLHHYRISGGSCFTLESKK